MSILELYEPGDESSVSESIKNLKCKSENSADKCSWLRSQIVGKNVEFETPFGKRRLTYADHTASGKCLRNIENYIMENVLPYYGNTHTNDSFVGERMSKMAREATHYIKQCMGGGAQDALLFCGSGSTAAIKRLQEVMGLAVPSTIRSSVLKTLTPSERWVVFTGPYEHHSNLLSWRQSLADVVEISVNQYGLLDMAMLKLELEDPNYNCRPKLGSFSACSNVTGIFTDTQAVARLLHEHGAFACFDFAASGPYAEIDMRSGDMEGYDAVFLSPHKFTGGPGTPGILLMSKSLYLLRHHPPSTCGGGTVSYVNGYNENDTLYHDDIEEREDAGTPAIIQKCRAALAFWVKEYIDPTFKHNREDFFIETAMRRLLHNPKVHILGNTTVKRQPILSFLLYPRKFDAHEVKRNTRIETQKRKKPLHGSFVTKLLNDLFGIQARGGCACAGPYGHALLNVQHEQSLAIREAIQRGYAGLKPGWTRISFTYYASDEEFEFILCAVEFLADYGHRFLALYTCKWKTGEWIIKQSALESIKWSKAFKIFNTQVGNGTNGGGDIPMKKEYLKYIAEAKMIAEALEFTEESGVPEEIDPELLLFRV